MNKATPLKQFMAGLPKNIFSGFVVSLIALPLGLGLAIASEAPPIAGIIAAIAGGMVVSVLGGSHLTITGPGNGLVIVVLSAIVGMGEGAKNSKFKNRKARTVVEFKKSFIQANFDQPTPIDIPNEQEVAATRAIRLCLHSL